MRRAAGLIKQAAAFPPASTLGPWIGTVGDPRLRLRPREIGSFSPKTVLRRWRSAIQKLRRVNPNIRGVAIVELQLCRQMERPGRGQARHFYEPHFHFVLHGVSKAQVVAAFRMRKNPHVTVRKRPVKVQAVYDLDGALGYMTKSRPEYRRQFVRKDGSTGWGRSRFPTRHIDDWSLQTARFSVPELVSATGFSVRELGHPESELATAFSRSSRRQRS